MDLPPESAGDELAEQIDWLATKHGAEAFALVAYSADSLPAHRLLTQLMDRLGEHKLTDVLYVGHGRWWSLSCSDECCPLTGTPFDASSHPLSAAAVFAGLGARADRRELEASVGGPTQAELPRLRRWPTTCSPSWSSSTSQVQPYGSWPALLKGQYPNQLFQMRGPVCCWRCW